ncbi:MAG: hypothetical protein K6F30_04990 [Lachnospiraceae bacterium]|nr:hypothetical protein [Lachnospiraceae bacterium]
MKPHLNFSNKYLWLVITGLTGCFILCYNLTSSGLWYDECVEYYFSKIAFGSTPGFPEFTTMYQRICFTAQPPLYNLLMWVWLHISDSELWFRLAGVCTAMFGSFGIFFYFQKKNLFLSVILTLLYISAFPTRYFALECGEYNLLAANVIWLFVFFLSYLEDPNPLFLTGFLIFSILSIYSQYGASFLVFGFGLVLLYYIARYKKEDLKRFLFLGIGSVVIFILPLIYFFLIPQMNNQGSAPADHSLNLSVSLIRDYVLSLWATFSYFFLRDLPTLCKLLMILTALFLMIFFFIANKKSSLSFMKYVGLGCFLSYTLYYFAVKTNFYGNVIVGGSFGNHWALSMGVMMLFFALCLLFLLWKKTPFLCYILSFLLLLSQIYSLFTVTWQKDNIREVIQEYRPTLTSEPLYLTYTEIIPTSYYTRKDSLEFTGLGKWTYHCENLTEEEITNHLKTELANSDSFYLIAGSEDGPSSITDALCNMGYTVEKIVSPILSSNNLSDMPMETYLFYVHY